MKTTVLALAAALLSSFLAAPQADVSPADVSQEPFSYSAAYEASLKSQRPLVVVVGAKWCPACRRLESEVIPQIKESGLLRQIALAVVDYDAESKTAQQLTRGAAIPQVLVFRRAEDGWKSQRLVGYPSRDAVLSFVRTAIQSDQKDTKTSRQSQLSDFQPSR